MANICRSPALAATLNHLAVKKKIADLKVDSCGIGWFHVGEHPDPRMFEAAKKRGILMDHRAQQFQEKFFDAFDLILTVDPMISEQVKLQAKTKEQAEKVHLVTEFSDHFKGQSIPDPYYMSDAGFDQMMDMIIDCCQGILKKVLNC